MKAIQALGSSNKMAKKHLPATKPPISENAPQDMSSAERRVAKSPTFFSVYTNDMQVSTSPWDLRIILGEVEEIQLVADKPVMTVTQLGEVRMSVQIAKRLTLMVADQLKTYEAMFGPIPSPKE
jgi:hypothetical protein